MRDNKIAMTVAIPGEMMKKLEVIARKEGCTVEDLVQGWMDDYVEHWKSPAGDGG